MSATCPHCGKPVPPSALGGLCPECMLDVGASAPTGEVAPGGPEPMRPPPPPPPAPEDLAPHFPQLEIMECLGRGGMGAVYRARQPKLDRFVALKILIPRPGTTGRDPGFTERFEREARALAQLNHPNIVGVHDFGEAGGHPYLVMEFVDGLNLRQMIRNRRLKPEEALAIVPRICEALQFAHEHGVIHRDIKPENILVDAKGQVKIADFGIAKILGRGGEGRDLTGTRDVMGTPHYMAPEQVERPLTVDHRADIYSLGVVFYEMLTGELPLGRFPLPSSKVAVDVRLDEVVLHALEKEPGRRYQHAGDVKTDIESIASSNMPSPPPPLPQASSQGLNDPVLEKRTNLLIFGLVVSVLGVPIGLGLRLPLVTSLGLVGVLVSLLKLSGRLQIRSPLFGDPYPGLGAALPHETRPFSPAQMALLAFGCTCCCLGIAVGLAMENALFTPVLVVLGIAGAAAIVPAMVLGRQVLTGPRREVRPAPGRRPVAAKPSRGCVYWLGTLLLAWFGLLFLIAIVGILVSLAMPAFQRERGRQAGKAVAAKADATAQSAERAPLENALERYALDNRDEASAGLSVAQDGTADYLAIQAAIEAATDGAIITIGPGHYDEILLIDKPLTLQGTGWEETVVGPSEPWTGAPSEAMQSLERRMHAATTDEERNRVREEFTRMYMRPLVEIRDAEGVQLRGLAFKRPGVGQDGKLLPLQVVNVNASVAVITDCAVVASPGHGITLENGAHATITNTLVAAVWSTGIVVGPGTSAEIIDCDIRNCHYAGISVKRGGVGAKIERCRISGAAWHGIRYDDVSPTIANNLIFANARSGIYASGDTAARVADNVFYANEMNGMSCWFANRDTLRGNTFAGNLREALAVLGASTPVLEQNIFTGHPIALYQGVINSGGSSAGAPGVLRIRRNLFWENGQNWVRPASDRSDAPAEPEEVPFADETETLLVDPELDHETWALGDTSPARKAGIGSQHPLMTVSPWPLQPEEQVIIPDGATRDSRKWKRVHAP